MKTDQHIRRRAQIIEVSRSLFLTKGFDNTSIAEIIDAVGVAKGTFYHYFRSKNELLEAMIEEMARQILERIDSAISPPGLSVVQRLNEFFRQSVVIKTESRELLRPMVRMMYRPENLQLRVQLVERSRELAAPILSGIIADGARSGEFSVEDPDLCGDFIFRSISAFSEPISRMILDICEPEILLREILKLYGFMEWAIGRLLGTEPGTVIMADRAALSDIISAEKETDV